jgi:Predicted membrane protein (DUF2157)
MTMDSPESAGRTRALEQIATLAREHGLSLSEIAAALGQPAASQENRWRGVLVKVLGFLGGTFVFAGIGVFIALQWDDMNSAARVIVTLGSGFVTVVLAILAARDPRFEKAATPLLLMAAALEPTGMLVAFNEYGSGGDWRWASLITSGTMALQFGAVFGLLRRSTPLFMTVLFATLFFWTALDLLDADKALVATIIGGSLLLAAIGIDRTVHRDITPVWYLLGAALFMYGVFDGVERTSFEIVFLGVAAGFVYLSVAVHSRTLLFVSTLAILAYTGWFTGQHFADSVGWPIALIAFGIFMIGLSALAMRIDRLYIRGLPGPLSG